MFMNATATSRFNVERCEPNERRFCLVGLVGFPTGLRSSVEGFAGRTNLLAGRCVGSLAPTFALTPI